MPAVQEIAINTLPFWSRFILSADLRFDGVALLRTILQPGRKVPVFDYKKGDRSVTALNGATATARDTILVQAGQTRGGGIYRIHGLSITKDGWAYVSGDNSNGVGIRHDVFPPDSMQPGNAGFGPQVLSVEDFRALDSFLAHAFMDVFRVQINIDGTRRILEMGPGPFYPGVGGASNGNVDTVNGSSFISNYMQIREGIVWNPSGAVDSNLQVELEASYELRVPTWTAPDGLAPDGTPIPLPIPTALGREWSQAWIVNFHGVEESPTSNVS